MILSRQHGWGWWRHGDQFQPGAALTTGTAKGSPVRFWSDPTCKNIKIGSLSFIKQKKEETDLSKNETHEEYF